MVTSIYKQLLSEPSREGGKEQWHLALFPRWQLKENAPSLIWRLCLRNGPSVFINIWYLSALCKITNDTLKDRTSYSRVGVLDFVGGVAFWGSIQLAAELVPDSSQVHKPKALVMLNVCDVVEILPADRSHFILPFSVSTRTALV